MDIIIKALSPELVNDYLYFFDHMIFSEHPDWSKCYCYSYHFNGPNEAWTKENNRKVVTELISQGKMHGYLAYHNEKPIGWCNSNNKLNYQALTETQDARFIICSIVCFLISPEYRGQGIAKTLLDHVVHDYSLKDYDYIEAYPHKAGNSCEKNYHGTLSMYERLGFKVLAEHPDHYIVRKKI